MVAMMLEKTECIYKCDDLIGPEHRRFVFRAITVQHMETGMGIKEGLHARSNRISSGF